MRRRRTASAKVVAAPAPVQFHIPAQPLASALQAYGEQAGIQVLYESGSASGRKSMPVDGKLLPEDALNVLLTGTDLRVPVHPPRRHHARLAHRAARSARRRACLRARICRFGALQVRATSDGATIPAYCMTTARACRPTSRRRCRSMPAPAAAPIGSFSISGSMHPARSCEPSCCVRPAIRTATRPWLLRCAAWTVSRATPANAPSAGADRDPRDVTAMSAGDTRARDDAACRVR